MAIYFIPVGIEANSKDEAEKKLLQMQQIVADYNNVDDPDNKKQQGETSSLGKDVLRAMMQIGLLWAAHKTQRTEEPCQKSPVKPTAQRERLKRKSNR